MRRGHHSPRRVTRKFRLARLFYRSTWKTWKFVMCFIPSPRREKPCWVSMARFRSSFSSAFGRRPRVWLWPQCSTVPDLPLVTTGNQSGFLTAVYLSGRLSSPWVWRCSPRFWFRSRSSRHRSRFWLWISCAVIGYLPFIYGSFSKREVNISSSIPAPARRNGRRAASPSQLCQRTGSAPPSPQGVGVPGAPS